MFKKILGTEPALVTSVITAAIALLVTIPELGLDATTASLVTAAVLAVGALVEGWTAVETRLALVVGLAKTLIALAVGFGLPITEQTSGALIAFITVVFGLFVRQSTSSADTPLSESDVAAGLATKGRIEIQVSEGFDGDEIARSIRRDLEH